MNLFITFTIRKQITLAAILAILGLSVGSPAMATTNPLPSGQSLFVINNQTGINLQPLDPFTAVAGTLIPGTGATGKYSNGIGFNPIDGMVYWLEYGANPTKLWKLNPLTGASTVVANMVVGSTGMTVYQFTVSNAGIGYAVAQDQTTFINTLYSVDLATGAMTSLGALVDSNPNNPDPGYSNNIRAIAFNPADSKIYLTYEGQGNLASIALDGSVTPVALEANGINLNTFTFDSLGNIWTLDTSDNRVKQATIATWGTTGLESTSSTTIPTTLRSSFYYVNFPPVAPPVPPTPATPALAETGAQADQFLFGAGALTVLGLGFLAANTTLRRRSKKQQ